MDAVVSTDEGVVIIAVLLVVLYTAYTAYEAALPRPLPNIPYNSDAAHRLLGDVPEWMGYVMRTKLIFCWFTLLAERHQSPIVQMFIKPLSLPLVVVTDPFESQDILRRRTKEFDRSGLLEDMLGSVMPEAHLLAPTSSARFKNNRNLINHLMTSASLSQISVPHLYNSALALIKLWKLKSKMAEGHPFTAHDDLSYMALDGLFVPVLGHPEAESITALPLSLLSQWRPPPPSIPMQTDQPFPFPSTPLPPIFSAMMTLSRLAGIIQLSPFPCLTSFLMRQLPSMRRAKAIKDAHIRAATDACLVSMATETAKDNDKNNNGSSSSDDNSNATPSPPRTAVHSILLRERALALKASRAPSYYSQTIADELLAFGVASHDTTTNVLTWAVKYLADHPGVQDRLRRDLRTALPHIATSGQTPSYTDLVGITVPYLEAVIWEVMRCRSPVGLILRRALVDTTVLGRRVPKGTDVFFMTDGPGFLKRNMKIADEERSPGARKGGAGNGANGFTGTWEDEGIGEFRPERWLKVGKDGEERFDATAGPAIPFGMGPRGCYGKRLGLMALKLQFALIVWHFHLLKVPDELNSYDVVQRATREPRQCYVRLAAVDS